jgi:hypothetical protein
MSEQTGIDLGGHKLPTALPILCPVLEVADDPICHFDTSCVECERATGAGIRTPSKQMHRQTPINQSAATYPPETVAEDNRASATAKLDSGKFASASAKDIDTLV